MALAHWEALECFQRMLAKHLDLVYRRLLNLISAIEVVRKADLDQ